MPKKKKKKVVKKKQVKKASESKLKRHHRKAIYIGVGIVVIILLVVLLFVQLSSSAGVESGDSVLVDYKGYLDDGSLFDEGVITVDLGQGLIISGFEENILGLRVGEVRNFTLTSEEAYGEVNESLILRNLSRELVVTRYSYLDNETFVQIFSQEAELNMTLTRQEIPWNLSIVDINETTITIENVLNVDDSVEISGVDWGGVVDSVGDENITILQNPEVGQSLAFPTPQGFISGVVVNVDETSFDVDTNHPLAGKSLTFSVEILEITKPEV